MMKIFILFLINKILKIKRIAIASIFLLSYFVRKYTQNLKNFLELAFNLKIGRLIQVLEKE
ncbi:hypothetical protein CQZ70_03655 [Mesoplasma florum]|nr:hypothetical protein CQZ70_03655 [Mesoplasma florum]AVN61330.1 hypothetical protein CG005_03520 [Mesoplasma florum]